MYKKTLTFVNYDGKEMTQDLYFHLNQTDLIKITAKYAKGFKDPKDVNLNKVSQDILSQGDWPKVVSLLEDVILGSYGERSYDGDLFIKSKEVRDKFEYSVAYAEMFELLLTDNNEMQAFMSKVVEKTSSDSTVTATLS